MTNEEIAVELARQGQHIKSNTHRIDTLEMLNELGVKTDDK